MQPFPMNTSPVNPLTPFVLLWRHRELLDQFTRRTIAQRHRGSFLGVIWTVLTPLLSLGLYTFVFGYVFKSEFNAVPNPSKFDYPLGLFLGLVLFQFLGELLAQSPSAIVTQPNFVKKVVFPLEILPAAVVGAAAFNAAVSFGLALLGVVLLGHGLDWHALTIFLIFPPVLLIGLGCAWFLAGLGVFVRDTANVMPFLVQVLIYTSAVFFSLSLVRETAGWVILKFNPLLHAVEATRRTVLWHLPANTNSLIYLWVVGAVICFIGYAFFSKTRHAFADVL